MAGLIRERPRSLDLKIEVYLVVGGKKEEEKKNGKKKEFKMAEAPLLFFLCSVMCRDRVIFMRFQNHKKRPTNTLNNFTGINN